MRLNIEDIKIKVKVVDIGKLKAIISLDFGEYVVKGFRVQTSQYKNDRGDELWLTPPSYSDKAGRYHPIFFMPQKDLWQELEKKIWEEYYFQKDGHYKKVYDLPQKEEIDLL
ncbi:MAG: hypothetical protein HY505_00625 [Candidatus Yanofskybacteria bacterium]|nr:hypothetical protein [Candidatus Yanofskybacteria bacterium]